MRRALAIDEASYGPDHPKVAKGLSNLARLLKDTKRLTEAGELVQRALVIDEKSYGPDHARVATDLNNLAVLRSLEGRWADAVALYARAKPILIGRGGEVDAGLAKARLTHNSWPLRHNARATHRAAARSTAAREHGFELAQWALQTDAADALAQMSARFAKGRPAGGTGARAPGSGGAPPGRGQATACGRRRCRWQSNGRNAPTSIADLDFKLDAIDKTHSS